MLEDTLNTFSKQEYVGDLPPIIKLLWSIADLCSSDSMTICRYRAAWILGFLVDFLRFGSEESIFMYGNMGKDQEQV